MFGIVAAVSPAANIVPVLLEALRKLEYRGDDSAGIAVLNSAGVQRVRTADTLAALRHAKDLGHTRTLTICNVPESAIVRECALRFITRAGPEIGVASTKALTTQLAALFLLTLVVGKLRGRIKERPISNAQSRLAPRTRSQTGRMRIRFAVSYSAARPPTKKEETIRLRSSKYP